MYYLRKMFDYMLKIKYLQNTLHFYSKKLLKNLRT